MVPQGFHVKPHIYPNVFLQAQAAPKKRPKPKEEEKSETVEPQTWLQKATASLPELLKNAADARTSSIKLHDMEYAKELSDQLLNHAKKLESLYQDMSKAVTNNPDEKTLKQLCQKAAEKEAFGTKAQAHSGIQLMQCAGLLSTYMILGDHHVHLPFYKSCSNLSYPFPMTNHVRILFEPLLSSAFPHDQAAADAFLKPKKKKNPAGKSKSKKQKK